MGDLPGGMYLHGGRAPMSIIALPTAARWAVENTIAHEFTHHALAHLDMPLWIQEGLTQMMEERATGIGNFAAPRELLERHRARWGEDGLDGFLSGEAFGSPHEDTQELAYHLAQIVVRSLCSQRPKQFFAMAREATWDDGGRRAARSHLGVDLEHLVAASIGLRELGG